MSHLDSVYLNYFFSLVFETVYYLLPLRSGQFICGNKHCDEKEGLASYEARVCSLYESSQLISSLAFLLTELIVEDISFVNIVTFYKFSCIFIESLHPIFHFLFAVLLQVNFSYFEAGENKQALVKLVACERLVALYRFHRFLPFPHSSLETSLV